LSGHVVVVGAGVAGLAAAWSARRAGHQVTVVSTGAGASAFGGGAVDDVPWEQLVNAARVLEGASPGSARPLSPEVMAFSAELGLWDVPAAERPWIATVAGRIRPARGRDRALLDLARLEGAVVLLPRANRAGWDADAIAATLAVSPFARARRLAFHAVDLPVLRFDDEHRVGDCDLAARHDDEARLGWLAGRLRAGLAANGSAGAILLGPWLGAGEPRAEALSAAVGLPCGEALVGAGSPAGLRFEAARDRMLDASGVRRVRDRVTQITRGTSPSNPRPGPLSVTLAQHEAALVADAVVLALGGVAAGGVIYAPPEHTAGTELPTSGKVPFELSVDAEVVLSADGRARMGIVSSMHGPELDASAWPVAGRPGLLEAVGVRCEGVRAGEGIYAAGDVVAGRPRTVLAAVTSGIAAGLGAEALTK
jgi:glycerol-3-phosphate dehydrogenase subunit B